MKLTPRDVEIVETFLDYCNPTSLTNRVDTVKAESGETFYPIVWTAQIGDISAESENPIAAMRKVLEQIQIEKGKGN